MRMILYLLFSFIYSIVLGGILEITRELIFFALRQEPFPYMTNFLVVECHSGNGFSPYFTYVEMMLIPMCVMWLFFFKNKHLNEFQQLRYFVYIFVLQTLWCAFLFFFMFIATVQYVEPEILNPTLAPTQIAIVIHCVSVLACLGVLVMEIWQGIKAARSKHVQILPEN